MGYQKLTPIIATGSSAPRYLGDRFADIVNLKDFGAAGDGETDDSAAWAAWQTALENGGPLYIPAGDYLLGSELVHAPKGYISDNFKTYTYDSSDTIINSLFDAAVYVNASTGDDSNDGLTKTTAVKSISEGIKRLSAQATPTARQSLYIAGGSYTENVGIYNSAINIKLDGAVNLTGSIRIVESHVVISPVSSGSLNVTNDSSFVLYIENHSWAEFACNVTLDCSNTTDAVVVRQFAIAVFDPGYSLAITGSSISSALVTALNHSFLLISSTFTIQGASIAKAIYAINHSYIQILNGVACSSGVVNHSIYSTRRSTISINGDCTFYGVTPIYVSLHSHIDISAYETLSVNRTGAGHGINASSFSVVEITPLNSDSTFTLALGSSTSGCGVNAANYGFILLNNTGKIAFSGKCSIVALSHTHSCLSVGSSNTISGSVTGKRYEAKNYGQIVVGGAGANRIPGSTAGTVDTGSYGLYS